MAITSAVASAAFTGYSIYKQSKQTSPTLASLNPPNPASDQMKADAAAIQAGVSQRKKAQNAQGYTSTILTSPSGIQNAPAPVAKTLLGR